MHWLALIGDAINRIPFEKFLIKPRDKREDLKELQEILEAPKNQIQTTSAENKEITTTPQEAEKQSALGSSIPRQIQITSKGKECRPCTSDHLATCAGILSEALRFARAEGMENDEVQDRIALCAQEMNTWERWDAAPESFVELSDKEKGFLRKWLPKGRGFRHKVNSLETLEQLEEVAALAGRLHKEARKELK